MKITIDNYVLTLYKSKKYGYMIMANGGEWMPGNVCHNLNIDYDAYDEMALNCNGYKRYYIKPSWCGKGMYNFYYHNKQDVLNLISALQLYLELRRCN